MLFRESRPGGYWIRRRRSMITASSPAWVSIPLDRLTVICFTPHLPSPLHRRRRLRRQPERAPRFNPAASAQSTVSRSSWRQPLAQSGGSSTPTGSVTFTDGSSYLGTATLNSGTASLPLSGLPVGMDAITASYSGNSSFESEFIFARKHHRSEGCDVRDRQVLGQSFHLR